MEYFTDYQISWDYELDDYINKNHIKLIKNIFNNIKLNIKNKLIKNIIITPIVLPEGNLGVYCKNTYQYIGLDIGNIIQACENYKNISLNLAIKTTILHEIAHALQDYYNKPLDEQQAEDFAYNFINFGIINTIK